MKPQTLPEVAAELAQREHDHHLVATLAWVALRASSHDTLGYNTKKRLPRAINQHRAKAQAYHQALKLLAPLLADQHLSVPLPAAIFEGVDA